MERKIGEIFELDGVKLRVDIGTGDCSGCFFYKGLDCFDCLFIDVKCCKCVRADETDVIFTEVKE